MKDKQSWDWSTPLKENSIKELESEYNWVEEPCISADGESLAHIVNLDEAVFGICVNGKLWDGEYEKAWNLKALPDNRLAACVCQDEQWSLVIDGTPWSNQFDFIWDLRWNRDGSKVGVAFQQDMEYGMAVNDEPWEETFESMTGMTLSEQGDSAAVVQVKSMAAADVNAFSQGLFSVAKNGVPGNEHFYNIWDINFDGSGENLTWAIRFDRHSYGVAVNGACWDNRFVAVWKPIFDKDGNKVIAPVRTKGKWLVYQDDRQLWPTGYDNIWHLSLNPVTGALCAIVAPQFGKWTIAQNDTPWSLEWDGMVRQMVHSKDGTALVAVFKDKGMWGLAKNDKAFQLSCDKIFSPSVSDDGSLVAVSYEKQGKYYVNVNDQVVAGPYEFMADPVIGPANDKVLVKGIENGIYKRSVITV